MFYPVNSKIQKLIVMVSVKIIHRQDKQNSNGEHPLYLRIIKNRKPKYIALGIYLTNELWDDENKRVKKSHPNAGRLNNYIATKVSEAQGVALEMETENKSVLPHEIKEQIMGKAPESFFKYADKYLADLETGSKVGTLRKSKAIIGKIREFVGNRDLLFNQITVSWLKDYERFMRQVKKNKTNTVSSNFRTLRVIINLAINEELIADDLNPFKRFKLTTEKVNKDYLNEDELMLIELAPLQENSMKDLHRDMYVFSATCGGFRISDLLLMKWKNYDGERIVMKTKKTGSVVSVLLSPKAKAIIMKYYKNDTEQEHFIFPVFKNDLDYSEPRFLFNSISSATAYANDDMKEIAQMVRIEKRVSMHTARHTFATRALIKGIPLPYVSKLLGHASLVTTQVYAKVIDTELDKAMKAFS